jgi:hypothetical protein
MKGYLARTSVLATREGNKVIGPIHVESFQWEWWPAGLYLSPDAALPGLIEMLEKSGVTDARSAEVRYGR